MTGNKDAGMGNKMQQKVGYELGMDKVMVFSIAYSISGFYFLFCFGNRLPTAVGSTNQLS